MDYGTQPESAPDSREIKLANAAPGDACPAGHRAEEIRSLTARHYLTALAFNYQRRGEIQRPAVASPFHGRRLGRISWVRDSANDHRGRATSGRRGKPGMAWLDERTGHVTASELRVVADSMVRN